MIRAHRNLDQHRLAIGRSRLTAMTVAAAALACTLAASTDVIQISPDYGSATEDLGDFSGSISYDFDGSTDVGNLVITLTNESLAENDGFITGFVFNTGSTDAGVAVAFESATHDFLDVAGQSAQPFGGRFDGGAALGGHWVGGGRPHGGIAVGQTGEFHFSVNASDASSLTASNFLTGSLDHNFVVRFRGFDNGGSDKMPAIPTPGALALLAVASLLVSRSSRHRVDTVGETA